MGDSTRSQTPEHPGVDSDRSERPGHDAHYPDPEIDNPDEPRCPVCGGAIDRTDVVCPHCGESLVAG